MCTTYTYLTGQFPYRSSRGNKYLLVGYHYDTDVVISQPLKDRIAPSITKTWTVIQKIFEQAKVASSTYIMDIEISQELIQALEQKKAKYHLVPPHTYRRNLSEHTIQTYKIRFKADLASVDPKSPLSD